jgi:acyl-CoA synthetase (AMP-forming)/AMP-acid ligase II
VSGAAAAIDPWTAEHRTSLKELRNLLDWAADSFGESTFLRPVEDDRPAVSFQDVRHFALGLDRYLDARGVAAGGRVAVVLHNSSLAALLFLGVIACRRVLVPLNPKSGQEEFTYILDQTEPGLVLYDPAAADRLALDVLAERAVALTDEERFLSDTLDDGRTAAAEGTGYGSTDPADGERDAEIVFTSGSSGRPKGVVLSHRSLLADSFALGQRFAVTAEDRFLTVCPLFHNSGQVFTTLTPLWCGAVTTAVRSEIGMVKFWAMVDRFQPHWTLVVNAFLGLLLSRGGRSDAGSLRGLLSGGSRLSPELIDDFEAAFNLPVHQVFGLTETTSVSTCEPDERPRKVRGSAGRALPCCAIRIVADGVDVAPGEPGEIWISGDNLFTGYLNQPELTAEKLTDGWLHTGDLGTLDEEGNLFIIDRIDEMVIVGGENVYPSEIEAMVPRLPGIREAIAVAVSHPVMGHEILLVHTPEPDMEQDPVKWREILVQGLSVFKVPRRYVAVDELGLPALPRAANGKILRGHVRNLAETWANGDVTADTGQ